MESALCESQSLVLREGQLYRFRRVGDCEKCAAMSAASLEAYGAPAPGQAEPMSESLIELERWHTNEAMSTHTMNYQRRDSHLEFAATARRARAILAEAGIKEKT